MSARDLAAEPVRAGAPTVAGPERSGATKAAPTRPEKKAGSLAADLVLQAKLRVGAAGDPLEDEADRMAAEFLAWQRRGGDGAAGVVTADGSARVGRSAVDMMGEFDVDADVEHRIERSRGRGAALPDAMRSQFEGFFGADLSGVRVHRGAESAELNRSISARAFTTGADVFLGEGESMGGAAGARLMAHELTHVVQQTGGAHRAARRVVRREKDALQEAASKGKTANTIVNKGADANELANSDKQVVDGANNFGNGFGLVTSLTVFYSAVHDLVKARANRVGEETLSQAVEAVAAAGAAVKSSLKIATTLGADLGKAVPGVGVALASLSLVTNATEIAVLHRAQVRENEAVAAVKDPNEKAALETVHRRTVIGLCAGYTKLVGDAMMVLGSVAELTPFIAFGEVVKLAGFIVQLGGRFIGWVGEQWESSKALAARERMDAAEASGDDAAIAKAKTNLLGADIKAAVHELVEKATASSQDNDPVVNVLAAYGLGPRWMARYHKEGTSPSDQAAQRAEGEQVILDFLGAKEEPKTVKQTVQSGLATVTSWFKGIFAKTDTKPAMVKAQALARGAVGTSMIVADSTNTVCKPSLVNQSLEETYEDLCNELAPPSLGDKRAPFLAAIDEGIAAAVRSLLKGLATAVYDAGTVVVKDGRVDFEVPQAAAFVV